MKNWHWIIALLYGVLIIALTLPVTLVALWPTTGQPDARPFAEKLAQTADGLFKPWSYWISIIVLVLSQAALLLVPVHTANKRPITKGLVVFPIIASSLMIGGLAGGAALAIGEAITRDFTGWPALSALILMWAFWAWIFYRWSAKTEPLSLIEKQCRILFQGSVLELLIAIPTHVYVRSKDYCSAGAGTFCGICMGLAVMILSFGPGVFYLYAARFRRKHPQHNL